MISIEVFSYFELICICKSFCMAASVYLNIHMFNGFTLQDVLYVATKHHVFSAHEQFIVTDFKSELSRAVWHNHQLLLLSSPHPINSCDSLHSSFRKKGNHWRPLSSRCSPTLLSPVQAASQ